MAKQKIPAIESKAIEIIQQYPDGIRHSELLDAIIKALPNANINSVSGTIPQLPNRFPDKVIKPDWGLYLPFREDPTDQKAEESYTEPALSAETPQEDHYYKPFADFLVLDLEECQQAYPLGRNYLGSKWNTPDVIGTNKKKAGMRIAFSTEIISVEIKINLSSSEAIYGFGQAVAYKLFSNKCYLVLPKESFRQEQKRLIALCMAEGIVLVQRELDKRHFKLSE